MKKILTGLIFILLVAIPAFSLDFDLATDRCLREILDKQEGEITTEDLQGIEEFYCYSTEVTIDSLKILAENLKDNTIISIGKEDEEGYFEGITTERKVLAGVISDDKKISPGICIKDIFIPGILDIDKGTFLPGIVFEGNFTTGIIIDSVFLAGLFDVEKDI